MSGKAKIDGYGIISARRIRPLLVGSFLLASTSLAPAMPTGVFLLYKGPTPPSADDCRSLSARVRPSIEKAEAWYWGRAPFGSELEFYLFLREDRMETTFSGEGDYDVGDLRNLQTEGGKTSFELVPDDHPSETISGLIESSRGSPVLTVTLYGIPTSDGKADRVSYYCSFDGETHI